MARILVVDDDHAVRSALRSILEGEGHSVREADDGHAAEAADAEAPADILILDIHMQERDGLETLRSLRTQGRPVKVIMTGGICMLCQVDFLPIARRLGADATLHKPIERDELLRTVATLLDGADTH